MESPPTLKRRGKKIKRNKTKIYIAASTNSLHMGRTSKMLVFCKCIPSARVMTKARIGSPSASQDFENIPCVSEEKSYSFPVCVEPADETGGSDGVRFVPAGATPLTATLGPIVYVLQ